MKRDEGGEFRLPQGELEDRSFGDLTVGLTDVTITRSRAIKLAGAALAGSALTILWPAEADARRRRRRNKRRRRKARVTTAPTSTNTLNSLPPVAGSAIPIILAVTNPSDSKPLTISNIELLGADGTVLAPSLSPDGVTIAPGTTANIPITVTYDPDSPLVDAGQLKLYDGREPAVPVEVTNGNTDGNVDLTFAPTV